MIPTQPPHAGLTPVADVRDGAVSRTGAGLVSPPDTSPARSMMSSTLMSLSPKGWRSGERRAALSVGAAGQVEGPPSRSTEQTCTRCLRSGAIKVTVCLGDRRWRFCQLCVGRGDKTTTLAKVACRHPYSRARNGGWVCLDCYEPVPAPAECATDERCTCELCAEAGRVSLATVLSVTFYGAVLVAIATATGKLTPTPNGFTLLCVGVLLVGCWRGLRRPGEQLEKWPAETEWPADAEPLADGATWPDLDPNSDWRVRS